MMKITSGRKQFSKIETNEHLDEAEESDPEEAQQNVRELKATSGRRQCLCVVVLIFVIVGVSGLVGYLVRCMLDQIMVSNDDVRSDEDDGDDDKYGGYFLRESDCLQRECCKSIELNNQSGVADCARLNLFQCIFEAAWCEWDCSYFDFKAENESNVPVVTRHRRFYGFSTGIGEYKMPGAPGEAASGLEEEDGSDSMPSSVGDVIEQSTMVSIDDCGVMYELVLDEETAEKEWQGLEKLVNGSNSSRGSGERRRRLQDGLIGSDDQVAIGQSAGGALSYPDTAIGCMTYESSDYGASSYGGYYQPAYTHICTGTLISPWHFLTSGACCHSGIYGTNFYSNWYIYPQITWYSQVTYQYARRVRYARTYSQWMNYRNYNYNYCILTLYSPIYSSPYIHIDYNIEAYINTATVSSYSSFSTAGYRWDKYSSSINNGYLFYGWKSKSMSSVTSTSFTFTHSAYYHGFSGAPIYYEHNNYQYCVISQFGYTQNTCLRITYTKYTEFCTIIGEYNGYSRGYGGWGSGGSWGSDSSDESYNSYCSGY